MEYLPVLINACFFIYIYTFFFYIRVLYLLLDVFLVPQNNLDVFLLQLLPFFPS